MKYYIFLDDSGQLHKNYPKGNYFIYGGLLIKERDFHGINQSYKNLVKKIKKEKGIEGELKTFQMDIPTRRRLLRKLSKFNCEQIFVTVNVKKIVRLDFNNKRDVARFKNYVIRRLVEKLIQDQKIPKNCSLIELNIDNQNIAHSARDSLEDHLFHYFNEDNYYFVHKIYDTTSFRADFAVYYKDSKTNYLIQAADLLANTKFHILHKNPKVRSMLKQGYTVLHLP